jgi:hypothetical protein
MRASRAALFGLLLLSPDLASASLLNIPFSVEYRYPDVATVYGPVAYNPKTFVTGPGTDTVVRVEDVTNLVVDFRADGLTITFQTVLSSPTWNNQPFSGLVFSTAGQLDLAAPTVLGDTTLSGFDAGRVTASGHEIRLNWNGLSYQDGTTQDVAFVPEPAGLGLLGVGLAAVALLRRRRA